MYNLTVESEGFDLFGSSQTLFTIGLTGQPYSIDGPAEVSIYEVTTTSAVVSWYHPTNNHRCIDHYEIIWENVEDSTDTDSTIIGAFEHLTVIGTCMSF